MVERHFESSHTDDRFAAERELLRGADRLPVLSNGLRNRVLTAATVAYRQARRWARAREVTSFLSVCLLVSFVLSPLANWSWAEPAWGRLAPGWELPTDRATSETLSSPHEPNSVWVLRRDHALIGWTSHVAERSSADVDASSPRPERIAQLAASRPSDRLLAALHSSDGWDTVQAFQAVRSRSHSTLQRAFAAN